MSVVDPMKVVSEQLVSGRKFSLPARGGKNAA